LTRLAIAAAGTIVVLAGEVLAYRSGRSADAAVLDVAIALTYLYGGLLIWRREPAARRGQIMILIGLTWQLGTLADSTIPLLSWIGIGLYDTPTALLLVLVLSYPSGQFDTAFDRRAAIGLAIGITVLNVVNVAQVVPFPIWINQDPNGYYVGIVIAATAAVLVLRRWVTAPRYLRQERAPVLVAGVVLLVTLFLNLIRRIFNVPEDVGALIQAVNAIAPAAIPVALLVGFYRATAAELHRSRARIVEATDAERRRLERDLHDGAQQRLVSLSLALRLLRNRLAKQAADDEAIEAVDQAADELKTAIAELRELARGIHPAVLTQAGLGAALTALGERSAVPASVEAVPDQRLSQAAEATAYFVVSEALANIAKHAEASRASITAEIVEDTLLVSITDDGVGGAASETGSGLSGLRDRVASMGGDLSIVSPRGGGTMVKAIIPLG
jgi:signal transduction histidine kinase